MIKNGKKLIFVSLFASFLLNFDKILFGPFSLIWVHDTFDSNFTHIYIHLKNILNYGIITQFPQTLCGVSSYVLTPLLSFNVFTQLILPPFTNYLFHCIFAIFIAFKGMFLLLNDEFNLDRRASFIASLFFSSITIWWPGGITIVGAPLLIWALERIFDKKFSFMPKIITYCYILLYFISSYFVHFGFVLLPFYLTYFLFLSKIEKKIRNIVVLSVIWGLYLLINMPAATEVAFNALFSHRNSFAFEGLSWINAFSYFIGKVFSVNMQGYYITMPTLLGLFIIFYYYFCYKEAWKNKYVNFVIIWVFFAEIFSFFIYKTPLYQILRSKIGYLGSIQFDRFYLLLTILFSILIGIAVDFIIRNNGLNNKKAWFFSAALLFLYCLLSFKIGYKFINESTHSFIHGFLIQFIMQTVILLFFLAILRIRKSEKNNVIIALMISVVLFSIFNTLHSRTYWGVVSWTSFLYKSDQIERIKTNEDNKLNNFRVVKVGGYYPAQLLNYGFNCADGYVVLYPQSYKEFWLKVIEPEITRSNEYRENFLGWGSRVYLFDSLNNRKIINELAFNPHLLRLINVKYLFSDKEIKNYKKYDLICIDEPNPKYVGLPKWKRKLLFKKEYYIYRNRDYAPQVFLTDSMRLFDNNDELLDELGKNEYQYLKTHTFTTKSEVKNIAQLKKLNIDKSKIIDYDLTPDKIEIKLRNKYPVILNLTRNYNSKWICKIDGKRADIFKIYNSFMGVLVPANSHIVEIIYINPYLNYAYIIICFGFVLINIFVVSSLKKNSAQ